MMTRFALFAAVALALLVFPGGDCGRHHWELNLLLSSHTAFAGDEFTMLVTAEPKPAVGYALDIRWGDTWQQLNEESRPDTFAVSHHWDSAGVYVVKAWGYTSAGWWGTVSEPETVTVLVGGPHAPVVDSVLYPPVAVRGETTQFIVYAQDPDSDSIRAVIAWNDSMSTTSRYSPSPSAIIMSHVFAEVETAVVAVSVQDQNGTLSLPDTLRVLVGARGLELTPKSRSSAMSTTTGAVWERR